MFDKIKNNDMVTFEIIEELEERTDVKVYDCGLSGKEDGLRWFVVMCMKNGNEKNLYVKY